MLKILKKKIIDRVRFLNGLANIIASEKIQSEALLLETIKSHLNLTTIFPQGFAVFRPEGVGVFAEHPTIIGRNEFSFAESEWFIKAKNSQTVIIGTPNISKVNGKLLMPIAKAIRNENGEVIGVLASPVFLDDPGLMDYVYDENHRQQGDILVISREKGIFIGSSNRAYLLKPTPASGENKFHDAVMNGFNGYDESIINGNQVMLTAAADVDFPDWFVVVRTPIEDAYEDLYEQLYSTIVNGLLVSLIALITITLTLYLFFRPLRKAASSVKEMVENTHPLTQIKIYKDDEIGDLIAGFNLLIEMVNERNLNLKKANIVLESLSQTDGLTGAANRRYFDETLQHAWRVQTRHQQPLTLLLIDIDYFKKYNDTYGHTAGDDCLKNVTKAIQGVINRPTDFFARYGGEEFVILLQGDLKEGSLVAEKARLAVSDLQIDHTGSTCKYLTISLGVTSVIPQLHQDPVDLIKQADQALYQSKANGRNRYELYENIKH
ncbi:sensor domain-containing diguanylate cyclase [Psychromonas algicola]|uniref:sensor domain-containing diguanylate cyclase n=1 Tax=Psychromonas algicola TaxID=2555642 RepID=UPI00106770F3|nr:diguanylate cyclase [Psychromonas sp. RZ5]TEW52557.1 diguanylate cyclase [Psychromonas sp. RZ5]